MDDDERIKNRKKNNKEKKIKQTVNDLFCMTSV